MPLANMLNAKSEYGENSLRGLIPSIPDRKYSATSLSHAKGGVAKIVEQARSKSVLDMIDMEGGMTDSDISEEHESVNGYLPGQLMVGLGTGILNASFKKRSVTKKATRQ